MVVTDEIDVTPEFTVSTVQFNSDPLNGIVTSLLTVFIIINIGSAVSKLVYCSRGRHFQYSSWLRAFIFANSDDPLRILSWISRNYVYRRRRWHRHPNKLRLRRLIVPLLARGFILIVSIVSVGITVPTPKILSACSRGDYRLELDPQAPFNSDVKVAACLDIPLVSDRGKALGQASYCTCDVFTVGTVPASVQVNHAQADGSIEFILSDGTERRGQRSYVEWKVDGSSNVFRSDLTESISEDAHMDLALDAIRDVFGQDCVGPREQVGAGILETSLMNCNFENVSLLQLKMEIESRVRHAMQWRRRDDVQRRIEIDKQTNNPTPLDSCVLDVEIERPVVNIVPLVITLLGWVLVNIIVSRIVSRHGNALDAGFHLVKEVFGHDTTSNPLEENEERNEVQDLDLKHWRCGAAGAHIGFWGRMGDIPVEDFTDELIVCGCSRVDDETDYMSATGTDVASSQSTSFSKLQQNNEPNPTQQDPF